MARSPDGACSIFCSCHASSATHAGVTDHKQRGSAEAKRRSDAKPGCADAENRICSNSRSKCANRARATCNRVGPAQSRCRVSEEPERDGNLNTPAVSGTSACLESALSMRSSAASTSTWLRSDARSSSSASLQATMTSQVLGELSGARQHRQAATTGAHLTRRSAAEMASICAKSKIQLRRTCS